MVKTPDVSRFKRALQDNWRLISWYISSFIVFMGLYTYKLSALTGQKASPLESYYVQRSSSWHVIYHNPLDAPYTITVRFLHYAHGGLLTYRLASVFWSLVAVYLFFLVVRRLHGLFVACIGTILFASSAWVLHIGRFIGPDVLLLSAGLGILLLFLRRKPPADRDTKVATRTSPFWFLVSLTIGSIYVPGLIWLLLLAVILRFDVIKGAWVRASKLHRSLTGLMAVILLIPFARAAYMQPKQFIPNWLDINLSHRLFSQIPHNITSVPDYLFWHGPNVPILWLGHIPIIEIGTALFAAIGAYYYIRRFKQTSILLIVPLVAWVAIGIGAASLFTVIVAFIYIYAAGGIAFILRLWQKTFPRNPIARVAALAIIIAIVSLITIYNTRSYFIAWAYSDPTKAAYQQKF